MKLLQEFVSNLYYVHSTLKQTQGYENHEFWKKNPLSQENITRRTKKNLINLSSFLIVVGVDISVLILVRFIFRLWRNYISF